MNDELKYSFSKLAEAVKRLEEGIDQTEDQLDRDGVIQRFEFTFGLLWKTLKLFLLNEGITAKSPKEALVETYRFGLINDEELFLDMLDDRNQSSHIYSEDVSKEIFTRIEKDYSAAIKKLLKELQCKNSLILTQIMINKQMTFPQLKSHLLLIVSVEALTFNYTQ